MIKLILIGVAALAAVEVRSAPKSYCPDMCNRDTIRPDELPTDAPQFSDFPSNLVVVRHRVRVDIRSNPKARIFRSAIRLQASNGINFAGHYTLIDVGCGTECSMWFVEDAISGVIYSPFNINTTQSTNIDPQLFDRRQGYVRFQKDSRLVRIVGTINEESKSRGISYFVWNGRVMERIKFVPHPDVAE